MSLIVKVPGSAAAVTAQGRDMPMQASMAMAMTTIRYVLFLMALLRGLSPSALLWYASLKTNIPGLLKNPGIITMDLFSEGQPGIDPGRFPDSWLLAHLRHPRALWLSCLASGGRLQ